MTYLNTIRLAGRRYGIVLALVVMVVIAGGQSSFLTAGNLVNISDQWTPIAVMALGMTFCLISGGFDLSVGATYALAATVSSALALHNPPLLAIIITLAIAGVVGLANGLMVTKLAINPLIATLGSSQIVGGAALLYSGGATYSVHAGLIADLGSGRIGGVFPVSALVLAGFTLVATIVLTFSTYGQDLYAAGGNNTASYISGIRTDLTRTLTYVITAVTAGVAGILYVGRVGSGQANIGTGIELQVIAAALIGGVSLIGGQGRVWQALTGVAILAVLQNFFNQASINAYWQSIVQGCVIVAAVGFDAFSRGESLTGLRHRFARIRHSHRAESLPAAETS
ncbi:ABC transporter permease [Amycolatopsis sp. CA-161197]|uniref:ABC transporter permease n=1 Tax=Amycolatopsis sp. CA-161197 TaxID=3239922 RepID=UPI003D904738